MSQTELPRSNYSTTQSPKIKLANCCLSITGTGRITQFYCPCCSDVQLEVGQLSHSEVCFCSSCHGFVIDSGNCGSLINELRASYDGSDDKPILFDAKQLEVRLNCAACGEPMEVHPYYGPGTVVIDSCNHCKLVWFNEGELGRIIRAPGIRKTTVKAVVNSAQLGNRSTDPEDDPVSASISNIAASIIQSLF